jgi:integrase/recombinase XerD
MLCKLFANFDIMETTTAILLDTRFEKKNKKYPVKLRITHERVSRHYKTGHDLTEAEYKKVFSNKAKGDYLDLQKEFNTLLETTNSIIKSIPTFSFDEYKKRCEVGTGESTDIFYRYRVELDELEKHEQRSSADNYRATYLSLVKFLRYRNAGRVAPDQLPTLYFKEVDIDFLKQFQRWFLEVDHIKLKTGEKKFKSISTLSIYLRTLRKLFNDALRLGDITTKEYPFGKDRYSIPKPLNNKRALELSDIKKLMQYECIGSQEQLYCDIWRLSYLCVGINITDLCRLQYKNIQDRTLWYYRYKNIRHPEQKKIVLSLPDMAIEIIKRHGSPLHTPDEYIFPFLKSGMSKTEQLDAIHEVVKQTNKHIGNVAAKLGINTKVTSYVARHSAATILLKAKEPIKHISDLLGHTDIKTTQDYLGEFGSGQKDEAAAKLTDF